MFERGGLIGLAIAILYVWLAPTHVVDGDNAELSTLGALGGAAHPSGYPLYVLYLRATSWLPGASPAHTAAIATALLAAVAFVALHAACRAWGAKPVAATLTVAVFAGAPVVLAMDCEAEVFALNGLVVACVLWLAARGGPLRGIWRGLALGLVAGLGLANNLTCALVAPIGILGVVRAVREGGARAAIAATVGLVLGLTPYLYLLVAPEHQGSWGHITSLSDVVGIILRREYGGPGAFAGTGPAVPVGESLLALLSTVGRTWLWLPAIAGLVALGDRIVRARNDRRGLPLEGRRGPIAESRVAWGLLLACIALAGPVLVTRFDVAPEGVGRYVVARFHILPALLLAPAVADALDRAGGWLGRTLPALARSAWLGQVLGVVAFVAVAGAALPHLSRVHAPAVEYQVSNTLHSLPERAVVFGVDDDVGAVMNYVQLVLGERRDVTYVHVPLLGLSWYRDRIAALGIADTAHMIEDVVASGRPVFVQPYLKQPQAVLPHYPFGVLVRILPAGVAPPTLDQVVKLNTDVYAKFDLDYPRPGLDDEWPTLVHTRYAKTWLRLAKLLGEAGRADEAQAAIDYARAIGPQP